MIIWREASHKVKNLDAVFLISLLGAILLW